jgi:gliding motility-associated-like protein
VLSSISIVRFICFNYIYSSGYYNYNNVIFLSKQAYILCLLKAVVVFACMVHAVNAQTITQYHKKQIAVSKKIKQGNGLSTTAIPAYCPSGPVTFNVYDTSKNNVSNNITCGSIPFYIEADNSNNIVSPCILTQYISSDGFLPANGSEYFYEGAVNNYCLGPMAGGCPNSIGYGQNFLTNHDWGIFDVLDDPSKQHHYTFSYQGLPLAITTVQLQDCWTGDSLSHTNSFGLILPNPSFTDSVSANTDIGTALYSIAPASATVALTDYHNGKAYVDPSLLSVGSYTVTYNFTPPVTDSCPTVTGTYTFSIGSMTISVNSRAICAGNSATLTATGPPTTTYSWSPATDLNATTGASVVATPTALSIYTVTGTKGSCTATATSTVTIKPTPTLTINSPSVCVGSSATLTASGATTYTWSPASGLSTTTGSTVTTHTLSTNTIYTVNATSLGCSSKISTTVTVNATPTVSVNSPTICAGSVATLTASGASTYTWNTSAISASITPSPTTTTTYTVTGASGGCSSAKTATVTVNQLPIITVNSATICAASTTTLTAGGASTYTWNTGAISSSITPSPTVTTIYTVTGTDVNNCQSTSTSTVTIGNISTLTINSATICAGNTTTLTASGATTYTWNTGVTSASITPSPTITTTYTVTGSSGGCSSVKTATVTVNSLPSISVNSPTICVGSVATLTASGASTYTWSTGVTSASITTSPTATTTYTVTGSSGGCPSVKIATVTVNSLPSISVNSPTICIGSIATLTASGASTYTWNTGATVATISPSPTVVTTYTVTGMDVHSCKNSATSTVTVSHLPTISVSSATICAGSVTTLTASGASTYTWNTGATTATITPSPTVTTTYTVTGTDVHACKNSATSTVTTNPLPVVQVNSVAICIGGSAILTANGANTYTWSTNATTATISTSPTITTTYTVTGTDINACENSATSTVTVNALPIVSVNSATICAAGTATLVAAGANTYTWSTAAVNPTISPSPTVTTIYTVTGTDIHGCENVATSTVSVNSLPVVTPTVNAVCVGQTLNLFANNSPVPTVYIWSGPNGYTASSQNPIINNAAVINAGVYTLSISAGGCLATNTISVSVDAMPTIANAGLDTTLYNSSLIMNGNIPLVGTGVWSIITGSGSIINSTQANTQVNNLPNGETVLQWTISNGACPASYDEVIVVVKNLVVPNGFSPNGDGVNDNFEVVGLEEYTNVKINVFNRWGNLVYDSGDYKNNWNGKNMSGEDLSDDTYFFTLEIPNKDAIKGYVVLKRK